VSLAARRKLDAAQFKVRRCEIRDGRRYVDGVDVGPAQPNAALPERIRGSARLNAARAARRKR
jgi:hypothetical protein